MGKVLSLMHRPIRDFNLESRAHKVISKEKPISAPKHKSNQIDYERLLKEQPNEFQEMLKKNEALNKHLKDVYVTSSNKNLEQAVSVANVNRPLPTHRESVAEPEYGFTEPIKVPYGRVTFKNALKFLKEHQLNPVENPIAKVAVDYNLPEETVKNVVKYFRIFEVYIPDKPVKAKFIGPMVPRKQIVTHKPKQISSKSDTNEK